MDNQVLITGATGMIGKALSKVLLQKGYKVSMLSRKAKPIPNTRVFLWNVDNQTIDTGCFEGVSTIIHLAGENIAGGRWTDKRKQQILNSRVMATKLLYEGLASTTHQVDTIISASAVGFYGNRGDEILSESSAQGHGFLAETCAKWEDAVDQGQNLGLRVVKLRTGVVLDKHEGGLPVMAKPVQLFMGAALGTGKQWVPWIHLHDLINMYVIALETQLTGTYNACAPQPVTNRTLTMELAKVLKRPFWPLNVPAPLIKTLMGEMSAIALNSNNTSAQKILDAGFKFRYNLLTDALKAVYK
jgi:uncharacterized protein (TIGR01777 family)